MRSEGTLGLGMWGWQLPGTSMCCLQDLLPVLLQVSQLCVGGN